jgi:putative nucleotidyltransferase with HDIG domain
LGDLGDEMLGAPVAHVPFVLAVVGALGVAAWTAWVRHRTEDLPRCLLLCAVLLVTAAVYAPHALLEPNADPTYARFGPLARAVIGGGLLATLLPLPFERLQTIRGRVALFVLLATPPTAVALFAPPDPGFIRGIQFAALTLQGGLVVFAMIRWWRIRLPFDLDLVVAGVVLMAGEILFLGAQPWQLRWWAAHLGLPAAAIVLISGIVEERYRRGRLSSALDHGGMADMAEHIVEAMSDGLAVFDDNGRLVGWNRAAAHVTGWDRERAADLIPHSTPDGLVPLGAGRWVRTQSFSVKRYGKCYRAVLFNDAREELRAAQQRESLEEHVHARTIELERTQLEVLERLAQAAELHDDETGEHTRRVGQLAAAIATEMDLPWDQVELIRRAAPLHDVGKIGVPDQVLLKPGRLDAGEMEQVRKHTVLGARILASPGFPLMRAAEQIALCHHERWDGAGYPQGLGGPDIPIAGRIVAVADVYDALTHDRPYKGAWRSEEAVAEILRGSGSQFDREVVAAFLQLVNRGELDPDDAVGPGRFTRASS